MTCHDDEQQRDSMREVELYRMFDHENLMRVVDSAILPSRTNPNSHVKDLYVMLPYYPRGTLQDRIEAVKAHGSQFSEREILSVFRGICLGVKALHQYTPPMRNNRMPYAHRDLKPGNVLLADHAESGAPFARSASASVPAGMADTPLDRLTPILMDFGSMAPARVKITSRLEALQLQDLAAEKCTMPYRAPELFDVPSDTTIDERVDIWALGCILYSLMYLQSPFESAANEQGGSIALAVISGRVNFLPQFNHSASLQNLVKFMLVVSHEARPHIDQVIEEIDAISSR
ncbi:NAK protein kinase [Capsaspora owczarzaki ATCC 30864]|uniref:non-specific serine/threonine protein kinase n=2 Tax=Capsaspora owczarzaki (strain ATCC 30864) TaxID=595528 RepID=A0A0D2WYF9_CAPO3|nr:NAK protein kinase [Capsaspora owczarzaki ATCC 30864]